MKRALVVSCILVLSQASGRAANPPVLAQQPALSATQVVFVFAGDLWSVPRRAARPSA